MSSPANTACSQETYGARKEAQQVVKIALQTVSSALDGLSTHVNKLLQTRRLELRPFGARSGARSLRRPEISKGAAFAAAIPGDTVVEQVLTSGVSSFLNLYNTVLIGRIILTWFPSAPPAIVAPLSTVTDPYLNLFRGIIPPLGGTLDLSPILAFVVLDLFTNAAAALPCELKGGKDQAFREQRLRILSPSNAVLAFQRRRAAERRRRQAQRHEAA